MDIAHVCSMYMYTMYDEEVKPWGHNCETTYKRGYVCCYVIICMAHVNVMFLTYSFNMQVRDNHKGLFHVHVGQLCAVLNVMKPMSSAWPRDRGNWSWLQGGLTLRTKYSLCTKPDFQNSAKVCPFNLSGHCKDTLHYNTY